MMIDRETQENLFYCNQSSSYEYFWTGNGETKKFLHSNLLNLLNKKFDFISENFPKYFQENLKNRKLKLKITKSCPEYSKEDALTVYMELLGELSGANPKGMLKISTPKNLSDGTFLLKKQGDEKLIRKAFILNIVPGPGLFFTDYGAFIRPSKYDYWIKFYKKIPKKLTDLISENIDKSIFEIAESLGCVELKRKKHFITPLYLHLSGFSDKEILDIYKKKPGFTKELLDILKKTYIYDDDKKLKAELKEDLIYLINPENPEEYKEKDRETLFDEFKNEFFEKFFIGKSGRWQIKRKLKNINQNNNLTKNDIKALVSILAEDRYEEDNLSCLSNNIVLQIGDYLEKIVSSTLNSSIRNFLTGLKKKGRKTNFQEFIAFLQKSWVFQLEAKIRQLFAISPLSQVMPETNILYDVTYQKKITRFGPGGITKGQSEEFASRDIHWSYYGRLCPLDTPQSDRIGLVFSLTENTRINEFGILESPCLKIDRSKKPPEITDEIVWLTPDKENNLYIDKEQKIPIFIAFGDQKEGRYLKNKVLARRGEEEIIEVPAEQISYIDYSPGQPFSVIPQLVPFLPHNDPARILVAVSLFKQALPLKEKEHPLIYTGMEDSVAEMSGQLAINDEDIIIDNLTNLDRSILGVLKGQEQIEPIEFKGKRLYGEPPSSKDGKLALGVNLLCIYVPWKGYNFEDAVIISEWASKKLTSRHYEGAIEFHIDKNMELKKANPFYSEKELSNLDDEGIIKAGSDVKEGTVLISAVKKNKQWGNWMNCFSLSLFGDEAEGYEDFSLIASEEISGKVTEVIKNDDLIKIKVVDERPLKVGDKIANRYGGKGVVSLILSDEEMPFFYDEKEKKHADIILNPMGVISRMNLGQIMETHLGWAAKKLDGRFGAGPFGSLTFESKKDNDDIREVRKILKSEDYIFKKIRKILNLPSVNSYIKSENNKFYGLNKEGKAYIYDPLNKNKELDNPVTAGYQYFMKLIQEGEDKFHYRSTGDYTLITEQPLKGKKRNGGQRIGEMEAWALQSHKGFNNLEEMFRVKSDDLKAREDGNKKSTPESIKALIYYLRGLCLDLCLYNKKGKYITDAIVFDEVPTEDISEVSIKAADEKAIKTWAQGEVKILEEIFEYKTDREEENGLYSVKLFGEWCGEKQNKKEEICPEDFNKIFTNEEINSIKENNLSKNNFLLQEIKRKLVRIYTEESTDFFLDKITNSEDNNFEESLKLLEKDYKKALRNNMAYIKLPLPVENPLNNEMEITLLPVIPFAYRPVIELNRDYIVYDLNRHYEKVLGIKKLIEDYDIEQEEKIKKRKKPKEALVKDLVRAVYNLFDNKKTKDKKENIIYPYTDRKGIPIKSIINLLEKKEGHFRKNLIGKRLDYSGRGVIAGDPELTIDETSIYAEDGIEDILILNRQPSLHKMSLMAFENRKNDKEAVIYLNPLVTGGFGGDFDGDTMAFHIPLSDKTISEAKSMFTSKNYLSPANGELHFNMGQDIKLGIEYAPQEGNEDLKNFKRFIKELLSGERDYLLGLDKIKEPDEIRTARNNYLKDILKKIFHYATISGTTFSLFDLPFSEMNKKVKEFAEDKDMEKYRELFNNNTLFMLYPSRARGKDNHFIQLCHNKGEVARIIKKEKSPIIKSCYLKGLTTGEYFYSNYGSIKTHVDKKLGTGHAGELARHLIEAAYDYIIENDDCGTSDGMRFKPWLEIKDKHINLLADLSEGELEDIKKLKDIKMTESSLREELRNKKLTEKKINVIIQSIKPENYKVFKCLEGRYSTDGKPVNQGISIDEILTVRTPLTCRSPRGICKKCYGLNPSTGYLPDKGLPAGIIAAQSIGERGTQLQMKTIHTAGIKDTEKAIGQDIEEAQKLFYTPGLQIKPVWYEIDSYVIAKTKDFLEPEKVDFLKKHSQKKLLKKEFKKLLKDGSFKKRETEAILKIIMEDFIFNKLLLWARNIYPEGSLRDIHFEVIFKAMLENIDKPQGLKKIAVSKDFLKALSFGKPGMVLSNIIKKEDVQRVSIEGLKKKLIFMINPSSKGDDIDG